MIQVGGVDRVIAAGVDPRHFHDQACREVYETCIKHKRIWGASPSVEAVRQRHPEFELQAVSDELGYIISEFRSECAFKAGLIKWRDIGKMLDAADPIDPQFDPESRSKLIELFMEHARELADLVPVPNSSRLSEMADRITSIRKQQETGATSGVKIGIPILDNYVHVIRPTEVVVHSAYSSVGKTTGLVRSSVVAYEEEAEQKAPVLFFSLEMEEEEIWEVFDSRIAQLSRQSLFKRELSVEDYDRYQRAAERVAGASNDIIVIDDTDGAPTIDKLAGLIDRFGPQTVCVDYLSLMEAHVRTNNDWERVSLISKSLKQLARQYKIRIYAAAQNSGDAMINGPTEDNIAFSKNIFMDCNVMVGYHQDAEMAKKNQVQIRLVKARGRAKPSEQHGVAGYEYWDRDGMVFEPWTKAHEFRMRMA